MGELISVADARERILKHFSPTAPVRKPLSEIYQHVLAEAIYAGEDLPAFANSAMDGYAVRSEDVIRATSDNPVVLDVIGDIPAGHWFENTVSSGTAVRVMTGAPIPDGSNAVVPIEYCQALGFAPETSLPARVQVMLSVQSGEFIRPKGQDVRTGELILPKGVRLRPQDIGMLAMLGFNEVFVHQKPRLALFSSGDELIQSGASRTSSKIYDSNSPMLDALIQNYGGTVVSLGVIPDRFDAVQAALDEAVRLDVDLILSTAGVSVGSYDYVRAVIEKHGEASIWRVNMRPGKPLLMGRYKDVPFIGLPGNPVSAFVGFEVFVHPVIFKLQGILNWERPVIRSLIDEPIESDGRESYFRAQVRMEEGKWRSRLAGHQGSGNLFALVQANALLLIPSGVKYLPIGSEVEIWLLSD
jgi:molybdopterin molybdotransferase